MAADDQRSAAAPAPARPARAASSADGDAARAAAIIHVNMGPPRSRGNVPGPEGLALAVEDAGEELVVLQPQGLDRRDQALERERRGRCRPGRRGRRRPRRTARARHSPVVACQTTAPSAAWVSPKAASRAKLTRLEPSRTTRSNSSMAASAAPAAPPPAAGQQPAYEAARPATATAPPTDRARPLRGRCPPATSPEAEEQRGAGEPGGRKERARRQPPSRKRLTVPSA